MKYALVLDNQVVEFREYDAPPNSKLIGGIPVLRPVVELAKPTYSDATHRLVQQQAITDQSVTISWTAEPLPLDEAKAGLRDAARDWLARADQQPVTALGIQWNGGLDSGLKLDSARRLVIEGIAAGLLPSGSTVRITDINNEAHSLSVEEATAVCLAVGQAYQSAFMQKQAWMRQIDAAQSAAELPAIA